MAMSKHALRLCLATSLAFAAQAASAHDNDFGLKQSSCPAGQAVQGVDLRQRSLICVPVGDVAGLQTQLNAANATITALQNALNAEISARQSGDSSGLASARAYADGLIAAEATARQQGDVEATAATRAYTDQQIAAEAAARSAGDTAALANANAYTDIKVAGVGGGGTTGQTATTAFGTVALNLPAVSETYTPVPGLNQTITVPANSVVYVSTDGGVAVNSGFADAGATVDVGLFVDGSLVGSARRLLPRNTSGAPNTALMAGFETWSMALSTDLSESTHTIEVGARLFDGARAIVSANSGVLQGKLTVLIVKK
jgi:hypothetical protein